jgi:HPt (histidine-containing phosphotransfer) domain-containing protein
MAMEVNRTVTPSKLAFLRERFTAALPDRIEALQVALRQAAAGSPIDDLERLLHRLAGSAGSYGLPAISVIAAEGERQCRDEALPRHLRIAEVAMTVEKLRAYLVSEEASDAD